MNIFFHGKGGWLSLQIIPKQAFHIGQVVIQIHGLKTLFILLNI